MGEVENVEVINLIVNSDGQGAGGDGICVGGLDEREVLKETQILETPPPPLKQKNFFYNRASGSGTLAKRKQKMEEEKYKARIYRENALAEYLIVKKRKIELENEEKEINIDKLKIELENARLENARLRKDLN
ncbi:uncharacterized protein LOC123702968 [Colias croceus]|uniref:uncharacterized protein LOC123702968 n=1 Tax=Colias crocea TaxID=72248 RepID=UPI001E27F98C|nr:uncharacterized protein LOC123702968 [Colias croceus]